MISRRQPLVDGLFFATVFTVTFAKIHWNVGADLSLSDVLTVLFLVAFDAAFTLFHEIFFPGGNWAFDFATERLVQLYPIPFWQEATTVIGGIVIAAGGLIWWIARRRARRLEAATAP